MSKHARQDDPAATHTSSVHKISCVLTIVYINCMHIYMYIYINCVVAVIMHKQVVV